MRVIYGLAAGLVAALVLAQTALAQRPIVYHTDKVMGPAYLVPAGQYGAANPAFGPDFQRADFKRGIWGAQTILPPEGLVLTKDGSIIDDTTYDSSGQSFGHVERLLVDPVTGLAHYAIIKSNKVGGGRWLPVPMTAIRLDGRVDIDAPLKTMELMEVYGGGEFERMYPQAPLAVPVVVTEVGLAPVNQVAAPPPPPAQAAVQPQPQPQPQTAAVPGKPALVRLDDLVGRIALDASGQFIGAVEYVVVDRGANRIAEVIVSAMFADGRYLPVNPANLRLTYGKVMIDVPREILAGGPSYDSAALTARYGPVAD
jgi:hypothetical protein